MDNKTADELFEDLHYMLIDKDAEDYLDYHITCKNEEQDRYYNQDIIFYFQDRVVYVKTDDVREAPVLNSAEIEAIQLKMKELGW